MFRAPLSTVIVLALLLAAAPAALAADSSSYEQVVDLTFPVETSDLTTDDFPDTFYAPRSNECGIHRATDIMADHGTPVHAAVGGEITRMDHELRRQFRERRRRMAAPALRGDRRKRHRPVSDLHQSVVLAD